MAVKTVANGGGNWNSAATWSPSGVPSATADNVVFTTSSGPLTISATATIANINFSNYQNTLTLNFPLNVNGPMNFGTSSFNTIFDNELVGGLPKGRIRYNEGSTITTNGRTWSSPWEFADPAAQIVTLVGDFILSEDLYFTPTTSTTIRGSGTSSMRLYGSLYHRNTAFVGGSASISILGSGTWSHLSTGDIRNNLTLNPSGTFTIAGDVHYNEGTLRYIAGDVVNYSALTYSTLFIDRSTTLDSNNLRWYNVTVQSTPRIQLVSDLYITGTLSVERSASISGTGSMKFTNNSNEVVGDIFMNPTAALMTFTFSNNTTVKSAMLGGDYNLTLNQNTLSIEKDLIVLTSLINFSETNNRVQGTTKIEMTGTGSLVSEAVFTWYKNTIRNNIDINTNGTIRFDYDGRFPRSGFGASSFTYSKFLYSTGTFSYISGSLSTGRIILEDATSTISGFDSTTFSSIAFGDWSPSRSPYPYTRTLISDIKANEIVFGEAGWSPEEYPTYNILGPYTIYTRSLIGRGTASVPKIHLWGSGTSDQSGGYGINYAFPIINSNIIISPTFGATAAFMTIHQTGLHLRDVNLQISENAGFTYSNSGVLGERTLWLSGNCTYSQSSNFPVRLGWGAIGSSATTHKLNLLSDINVDRWFYIDFWKFNNTAARHRSVRIENTERLKMENATLALVSGSVIFDHGITASTLLVGTYSIANLWAVNNNTFGITASGFELNFSSIFLRGYLDLICDSTINVVGNSGRLNSEYDYYANIVSNINLKSSGTLTYGPDFNWASPSGNNFKTFRYISGTMTAADSDSVINLNGFGGYLDLDGPTWNRIKFADGSTRNTTYVLQSDINVSDKVSYTGTVSFTFSSFSINNAGDLELRGGGDYNLRGTASCRDFIITNFSGTIQNARIFNGDILVRRSLINLGTSVNLIATASGTKSTIYMIGTGSMTSLSNSQPINVDITIDTPGTITNSNSSFYIDSITFSYVNGKVNNSSTYTLFVEGNSTFDTTGMTFSNVTFGTDASNVNLKSKFQLSSTASLSYATFSFTGNGGFDVGELRPVSNLVSRITLNIGTTYSIRRRFVFPAVSSNSSKHLIRPNTYSGTKSILIVDYDAVQDLPFVSADLIDSSGGATVWTYKGTLQSATNWNQLPTQPKTISSSSQS